MPFCRKCGRRLAEYSEACTDCGTSTTAPIINTKRTQSGHSFNSSGDKKIAKAIIPKVSPVQIKVITDKPTKATATSVKAVEATKPVGANKTATSITAATPFKIATPTKDIAKPKPVLSAKHIVKPKRTIQTKPTAPFSITFARPVTDPNIVQRKVAGSPGSTIQPVQPRPQFSSEPALQHKPIVTLFKPVAPPKPITPAPIYASHEIIQSKISLKEDILAHPEDYEMQSFSFNLKCPNDHFWQEGKMLPVSKGKAYCLKCGERLSKPKAKKRHRYHRY